MEFNHMIILDGGVIQGKGRDPIGQFQLQGNVQGNNVNFIKQYIGAHSVQYNGVMNNNVVSGKWSIPGNCQGGF
jgi:hypothetical protein